MALGPPEVRLGEKLVTFPTRKTLALLIYLAIQNGQQPREHLASLFWPDTSSERSFASLRNTLSRLQAALREASGHEDPNYIFITNAAIGLNPEASVKVDVERVNQAYELVRAARNNRAQVEETDELALLLSAAAYLRGEFLSGLALPDAPAFDDWAVVQREDWHRRLSLILDRLSEIQFARGEFSEAVETASRWIALDSLNEAAYRRKMRIQYAAGERAKALETYETCRTVLATELGIEPEADTDALAGRIRAQADLIRPRLRHTADKPASPLTSVDFLGSLFTGRASETEALTASFTRATEGQPQVVLLQGESGIGKTRLASKFIAWARSQGAELLLGGAFESSLDFPFQPLVEALRLRLEAESSLADLVDTVWLAPLSQLAPELRRHDPDLATASSEPGSLEAELNQSNIFEAIVQLTLGLAKQAPLLLFVDDLQWADSATLDLLQYAMRRWRESAAQSGSVRVMLLASMRTEALQTMAQSARNGGSPDLIQWLTRVERELTPIHLELVPLSEFETEQLVSSILAPPSSDFARWIYSETHGHPYYLVETLKDLLERRVLRPRRQTNGQWTFSVNPERDFGEEGRVPTTVHAVIRSRLNRLSPNAFNLLAGAAVLEQPLTFERLSAIANIDEDAALPALDELTSGRLLLESGEAYAAGEYVFVNDMLRDVVYTEAGDARRRLFHRRALELLESQKESPAVLAHHALATGLIQEAFHHSLAAGREALRLSALSEADAHFERALKMVREESLPEVPDEAEVRKLYNQLARIYELTDQKDKAAALQAERDRYSSPT